MNNRTIIATVISTDGTKKMIVSDSATVPTITYGVFDLEITLSSLRGMKAGYKIKRNTNRTDRAAVAATSINGAKRTISAAEGTNIK